MVSAPDPLADTLFRSTAPAAIGQRRTPSQAGPLPADSEPPRRPGGTRSRAGNTMARTRTAVLAGARDSVIRRGLRVSMSDIAAGAGVAKATLYNHFRTREAVLAALLLSELESAAESLDGLDALDALTEAGVLIGTNPLLRSMVGRDHAALVQLMTIQQPSDAAVAPAWHFIWRSVTEILARQDQPDPVVIGLAVRWLVSFVLTPSDAPSIREGAQYLLKKKNYSQPSG